AFLGEYKGAYNRFSFDITDAAASGENLLAVQLDSTERKEIPPFGKVVDYLVYGGIYREVWIEEVPAVYLADVFVRTRCVTAPKKVLDIDVTFSESAEGTLKFELLDGDSVIAEKETAFKGTVINAKWAVEDVKLWDVDDPNLYTLRVSTADDEVCTRFGFRECRFKKEGFFLNGKHLKLRGLDRHQSYPYVGYAMPANVQRADADLLKKTLGVNIVRTAHYPDSIHFLDRCDEIGLLVFTEIPSWQYLGEEGEWRDIFRDNVRRMVLRDRNHPSVVLWGVRVNEGMDCDELYSQTNKIAHDLDDTRQTGGVRNFPRSHLLEDVYTFNDFSHSGGQIALLPPAVVCGDAPLLVTEHNGHMYPTKSFDREAVRLEHALRHTRVLNRAYGDDRYSGAIGWDMADYNTHKDFGSGDRVCYHGVTDMFRVPKLGAAIYRSQQEDVPFLEVSSSMDIGEHPAGVLGKVWVFTNCDSVKLYKNGKYTSTIVPADSPFKNLPHPPMVA
ncbi:MAG: glycoside hydrolase family 2 protein, partial [Clostridia bacterium]|nr:glycoside hydrolase family 2 protein [Clostridia bacterium]